MREIQTIYGQLQDILGIDVKPAPDKWDRLYNVDFFIEVYGKFIGIQLSRFTSENAIENFNWAEFLETSYCKFKKKFGGVIFIVFYVLVGKKKLIYNFEVIAEIKKEIERLKENGS